METAREVGPFSLSGDQFLLSAGNIDSFPPVIVIKISFGILLPFLIIL